MTLDPKKHNSYFDVYNHNGVREDPFLYSFSVFCFTW